jgi:hypothetical protein
MYKEEKREKEKRYIHKKNLKASRLAAYRNAPSTLPYALYTLTELTSQ